MDKVLIDITRLLARALEGRLATGVDRVSMAYVAHYRKRSRALVRFGGRWIALDPDDSRHLFDALLEQSANISWIIRWLVGRAYVLSWGGIRASSILFNISHSGLNDATYGRETRRRNLRPVFFLHDLIPITHPEYCRPGELERHRARLSVMLSVAEGVIVNSADTEFAFEEYAKAQGLPLPPCVVAPLAPAALPYHASERPVDERYFVMLGTIEPRKNHHLILHVWRQMVEEMGRDVPKLIVIGQRGWECEQVIDMLERCTLLQGIVVEKSRCTDAELFTWLHHASALLFPSFVEGYGMPLVEALSLGVPVIASDLPVFREIAGAVPEYLNPLDGPNWKRMIIEYVRDDSSYRKDQLRRLESYSPPTWERHFLIVDNFLETLKDA